MVAPEIGKPVKALTICPPLFPVPVNTGVDCSFNAECPTFTKE
jgi:hypothetical protein